MKKWIIALAVILALLLTACGDENAAAPSATGAVPTAPPTEPPTQLHTVAPRQDAPAVEWVNIDAKLTLEDSHHLYAKDADFICFALVGNSSDAELRFRLDDATAAMLREQNPENRYYITMDEKRLGDVELNESCNELTLVGEFSYTRLCSIANRIRGLE